MKKLLILESILSCLFTIQPVIGQDITPVYAVDTVSMFDTLSYDVVIYDGSPWIRKAGVVAENGGTLIESMSGYYYERQYSGDIDARWFGMLDDASTDNTSAIRAAVTAAVEGQTIFIPEGDYLISDEIIINKSIKIKGTEKTRIIQQTTYTTIFRLTADNISIDNITFSKLEKVMNRTGQLATDPVSFCSETRIAQSQIVIFTTAETIWHQR